MLLTKFPAGCVSSLISRYSRKNHGHVIIHDLNLNRFSPHQSDPISWWWLVDHKMFQNCEKKLQTLVGFSLFFSAVQSSICIQFPATWVQTSPLMPVWFHKEHWPEICKTTRQVGRNMHAWSLSLLYVEIHQGSSGYYPQRAAVSTVYETCFCVASASKINGTAERSRMNRACFQVQWMPSSRVHIKLHKTSEYSLDQKTYEASINGVSP